MRVTKQKADIFVRLSGHFWQAIYVRFFLSFFKVFKDCMSWYVRTWQVRKRYYNSKKDIYLDLVNYWVLRYSDMVSKILEKDQKASLQLKKIFSYFIDEYEKDPEPFKALTEFWSMAQKDKDFRKKLQKV